MSDPTLWLKLAWFTGLGLLIWFLSYLRHDRRCQERLEREELKESARKAAAAEEARNA